MNSDLNQLLLLISKVSKCLHNHNTGYFCTKKCNAIRKIAIDKNDNLNPNLVHPSMTEVVNQVICHILELNMNCYTTNAFIIQDIIPKICSKINIDQPQYITSLYKIMSSNYITIDHIFDTIVNNKDFKF